jgi:branched-chain amino acid transport system substrate-binding protein
MAQAIKLAVDEANERAGSDGLVLSLSMDDNGSEEIGTAVARTFSEDAGVVAVIGHYNSNVTLAAAPIYSEANLPIIAPIVSNPKLTESGWGNVFRLTNRDDFTAAAIADHLVSERGKRRAAVVATETVYGNSMSREFSRAFERLGGKVLSTHSIQEGETTFRDLVRQLPIDADVLFYGGTFEGAPLLRSLRDAGLEQLFATGDGCWDVGNFLMPAGPYTEYGEGVLVLSACPEVGRVEGSADFTSRFELRYGPVRNYGVNSYDAATLTIECLRAATRSGDSPDRQSAARAIREVSHRGIAYKDPVRWDEKGDNLGAVTALHVVKDGRFHQVAEVPKSQEHASA